MKKQRTSYLITLKNVILHVYVLKLKKKPPHTLSALIKSSFF